MHDSFQRFIFENMGIRGEIVRLDDSWQAIRANKDYPPVVAAQLGQALAASILLSGTIKFQGALIVQIQGKGPINTLVAQATHTRSIRGLAHWQGDVHGDSLAQLFGEGRMVLTVQNEGNEPYQGIVALEGASLADSIEAYFNLSEQLPTRLWLAADAEGAAAGLFIQALPAQHGEREDFDRINALAGTITPTELLTLPAGEILLRLFNEDDVRLFEPEPVVFRCSCSRERIESVLLAMGREEIEAIIEERGRVEVDCEFCNRHHHFDAVDIGFLFSETPSQKARGIH
jgi:molecular chaperone Hsp33